MRARSTGSRACRRPRRVSRPGHRAELDGDQELTSATEFGLVIDGCLGSWMPTARMTESDDRQGVTSGALEGTATGTDSRAAWSVP